MKVFEIGSTVYSAYKWGRDVEVQSAKVLASTERQLTLSERLNGLRCRSTLRDPDKPPSTTRLGAIEDLRADAERKVDNAEAHLKAARAYLAEIDAALKKEQP